jgi:hypothetical protein
MTPEARLRSPRARGIGAFTLLEVLAAVLVLGMLYTVLADVAIQGLRAEGLAKRRLEASLRADALLADIESQMMFGLVPPISEAEEEDGNFVNSVSVTPIELATLFPDLETDPNAGSLLEPEGATGEPRLRRIEVRVSWLEGIHQFSVQRTTVALDMSGLEEVFPPADAALGGSELPDDLGDPLDAETGQEAR